MIYVTRPFLPPICEMQKLLAEIWEKGILTNQGPFHEQLEIRLADYLNVPFITLFNNGSSALIAALRALDVFGEVITSPFSFVATSHALLWSNAKPIFADIDPITLNLDVRSVEQAINPKTTAILPVHCYGTPCDVHKFDDLAKKYNLKIIYDAAHAFGAKYEGKSLASFGDVAALSFHATKVFNTFEGGAVVSHQQSIKDKLDRLRRLWIFRRRGT